MRKRLFCTIALNYLTYDVLDLVTTNTRLLSDITYNEIVVKVPSELKPTLLILSLGEGLDIV
ncbi:MAG: hypothetical protein M3115_06360 [Thermoproteota archaeon]|nr:hypothetical protein [Thermoproteota archaeon]